MKPVRGDGAHVTPLLGLHTIDALDERERVEVVRHLTGCEQCRADFEYVRAVPPYLSVLRPEQVADLLPAPGSTGTGAGDADGDGDGDGDEDWLGEDGWPTAEAWSDSYLPGPRPDWMRPPDPVVVALDPVRRRRRFAVLAAVAAALLVVVGTVTWLVAGPGGGGAPPARTLVAEAPTNSQGVSVSIQLTPQPAGISVQATVRGQEPGRPYDLVLTTVGGQSSVVASWPGQAAEQVVRVDSAVALDQVGYFSLVEHGGPVVAIIPFASSPRQS